MWTWLSYLGIWTGVAALSVLICVQFQIYPVKRAELFHSPRGLANSVGLVSGVVFDQHENGNLSYLSFYWRGVRQFYEWTFYQSGQRSRQKFFWRGIPVGEGRQWFPNGAPKSLITYSGGQPDGEYWKWHLDGKVAQYAVYDNGRERVFKTLNIENGIFDNLVFHHGSSYGFRGERECGPSDFFR